MPHATYNLKRGYPIALLSAVILSTTAILIRHLTQTYALPPLVLAFWRDGFVALTLLPFLLARRMLVRLERKNWVYLVLYGFLLAVFNAMWTLSVSLNGAAIATVLAYASAGFTALLGWWILKERLDWGKGVAVLLSLAGCVLVSGALDPQAWAANMLGILTGVLSGLLYAIYTLMGRAASQRGLNPWMTIFYTFGFATVFLFFFNWWGGGVLPGTAAQPSEFFWLGAAVAGWLVLFALAAGPTVLGFGLYNLSLTYLPSSVANLVVTLEPAFTAAIAYVLLGERLTSIQLGGSLLILAGVVFLRIYEERVDKKSLQLA